jgi:hypothetical protein
MTAAEPWQAAEQPRSSETVLMRQILAALSQTFHPAGVFWRVNVGRATDRHGNVIRFGLPGQADIAGVIGGRHVEIEVKALTGRQSQPQRNWQAAVERAGGTYILARSVEDAIRGVRAAVAMGAA